MSQRATFLVERGDVVSDENTPFEDETLWDDAPLVPSCRDRASHSSAR